MKLSPHGSLVFAAKPSYLWFWFGYSAAVLSLMHFHLFPLELGCDCEPVPLVLFGVFLGFGPTVFLAVASKGLQLLRPNYYVLESRLLWLGSGSVSVGLISLATAHLFWSSLEKNGKPYLELIGPLIVFSLYLLTPMIVLLANVAWAEFRFKKTQPAELRKAPPK